MYGAEICHGVTHVFMLYLAFCEIQHVSNINSQIKTLGKRSANSGWCQSCHLLNFKTFQTDVQSL